MANARAERAAEVIKQELDRMGSKITKEQHKAYEEVLLKIFRDGQSPKEAMGLSDEAMEAFYGYAYRLYQAGNFADSQRVFQHLVNFNASETKYAYGLAACYHMQHKYQAAIEAYMLVAFFDQFNPLPFFHIADCYLKMEKPVGALLALNDCIRMSFYPKYTMIREKAVLMRKKIRDDLGLEDTPPPVKDYFKLLGCDLEGVDIEKIFVDGEENYAKLKAEVDRMTKDEKVEAEYLVSEAESLEPGRAWEPPKLEL